MIAGLPTVAAYIMPLGKMPEGIFYLQKTICPFLAQLCKKPGFFKNMVSYLKDEREDL